MSVHGLRHAWGIIVVEHEFEKLQESRVEVLGG